MDSHKFNAFMKGLSRRQFLGHSAKAGGMAAIAASVPLPFSKSAQAQTPINETAEQISYSACLVNCGSRCPLKVHTKDGVVTQISTENGIDDEVWGQHQIRPCLRGRSVKWKTYSPDRLKYPMKRVGKRGEGKFQRISWDEATTIIADKLKYTIEEYGNEAIYYQYGSGSTGANLYWVEMPINVFSIPSAVF